MTDSASRKSRIRWWPAIVIFLCTLAAVSIPQTDEGIPFQQRNIAAFRNALIGFFSLGIWWVFLSKADKRRRFQVILVLLASLLIFSSIFRVRGVNGDLLPILEVRWRSERALPTASETVPPPIQQAGQNPESFPQFLGRARDGIIRGKVLKADWSENAPRVVWQREIGAGWSGFAVSGRYAITLEQRGEYECICCYDSETGKPIWTHSSQAHYATAIGGSGPRSTPTVLNDRVFALGATGNLYCVDLASGRCVWTADVRIAAGGKLPAWGFASSPLVTSNLVVVHTGEAASRSLAAFRAENGKLEWTGVKAPSSYASPLLANLAGVDQILSFNEGSISAANPADGSTLWERPWGNGNVVCSTPLIIDGNRVVFSSGYGFGTELIQVSRRQSGGLSAERLWRSPRLKSKFGHLFARDRFLYGLDDGIFACLDLRDGSQRWKEGRYGHGQGLVIGRHYLLVAESGELILLEPTPDSPNERARKRVFKSKTWNPPAIAGDLLFVRNDQEAACIRLPLTKQ